MTTHQREASTSEQWVGFPGGELEGIRPRAMCAACRQRPLAALCFQCYRAELDRERALRRAGELDTASPARFQVLLPFEPVDRSRLDRLRAERAVVRAELAGRDPFVERRRQAQIAARHALEAIAAGLRARGAAAPERDPSMVAAVHAAELQLPEAWLPFVIAR